MKPYTRQTPAFSLCGLNCCLCPKYRTTGISRCPGCGGDAFYEKHPTCAIVSCSLRHGGVFYCFQCREYPCQRYTRPSDNDSFITYLHVPRDMDEAKRIGLDLYLHQLSKKSETLDTLLEKWDNGRLKSFYCLAVNLLPQEDLDSAICELEQLQSQQEMSPYESQSDFGKRVKEIFNRRAALRGIELKLRK